MSRDYVGRSGVAAGIASGSGRRRCDDPGQREAQRYGGTDEQRRLAPGEDLDRAQDPGHVAASHIVGHAAQLARAALHQPGQPRLAARAGRRRTAAARSASAPMPVARYGPSAAPPATSAPACSVLAEPAGLAPAAQRRRPGPRPSRRAAAPLASSATPRVARQTSRHAYVRADRLSHLVRLRHLGILAC